MRIISVYLLILGLALYIAGGMYGQEKKKEWTEADVEANKWRVLGNDFLHMGRLKKAKECFDKALQWDADNELTRQARLGRILVLLYMDEPKLALEDLKYLRKGKSFSKGDDSRIYRMLGGVKMELTWRKEYQKHWPDYLPNNAYIYELEGNVKEAERLWSLLVETDKECSYYRTEQRLFYERQGNYQKILDDLGGIDKARVYQKMGDISSAYALYLEAIKSYQRSTVYYYETEQDLAFLNARALTKIPALKEKLGEVEPLWKDWVKRLESFRENYGFDEYTFYTKLLVAIYAGKIKPEVMEERIKAVEKRAPYSETILRGSYYLGLYYKWQGEKTKAEALFKRVVDVGSYLTPEYALAKAELE